VAQGWATAFVAVAGALDRAVASRLLCPVLTRRSLSDRWEARRVAWLGDFSDAEFEPDELEVSAD
jgi:hypothetical protein